LFKYCCVCFIVVTFVYVPFVALFFFTRVHVL
jgi:hypothetical protein